MNIDTKVNRIPSITWTWLKINEAQITLDKEYKNKTNVTVSKLQEGVTYEKDAEKYFMSVTPIDTGMGKNVSNFLFDNSVIPGSLVVEPGVKVSKPVYFNFDCKDKSASLSSQIITAKKDSEITVIACFFSDRKAEGLNLSQFKLYAQANAKIHLITVQLLGDEYIHLEDIGTYCEENANIEVTQVELGGKKTYTGINSLLKEYNSSYKSDTAYFARKDQEIDMNYVTLHAGRKTDCNMMVYGTLKDNAKKTYRGTIDFRKGCNGATGNEQEETLLLTPTVVNKSIPVILCDEEDVAGEHGASIGKLAKEVLFYMNAHGIDKDTAEKLMAQAKINRVAAKIPDESLRTKIDDYVEEVFND